MEYAGIEYAGLPEIGLSPDLLVLSQNIKLNDVAGMTAVSDLDRFSRGHFFEILARVLPLGCDSPRFAMKRTASPTRP
jgi:hypothetical protein